MGVMNTTKPKEPIKCPRCESTNTKFCYYNNYNKSQPRHFCKGCKRHWTQGGLFRNLPIGGGRKNKLKITSTSRDDNRTGQDECRVSLTLTSKIFNPSGPASTNTSGITRERSSAYDQNFPLVSNNIDEEKNIIGNFPSYSQPYDTNIPFSIPTSSFTSSNIYNYMENLDSTMEEESIITWQLGPIRRSSVMDNLSNYWNWDDIEALVSADDLKNELG